MAVLLLLGCGRDLSSSLHSAGEALGVTDPLPAPPVVVSVVLDASPGSIEKAQATALCAVVLSWIAAQPQGSELRVYRVGDTLAASSAPVLTLVVPTPGMSGPRGHKVAVDSFLAAGRPQVSAAVDGIFASPPRRSPLASVLVSVAIASHAPNARTVILFAADGRQEDGALGHFECDPRLPSPAMWQASLRRAGLFLPGQLAGTRVLFAFFAPTPVARDRCGVDMDRFLHLQALWRTVIEGSGGRVAFFTQGVPVYALEGRQ